MNLDACIWHSSPSKSQILSFLSPAAHRPMHRSIFWDSTAGFLSSSKRPAINIPAGPIGAWFRRQTGACSCAQVTPSLNHCSSQRWHAMHSSPFPTAGRPGPMLCYIAILCIHGEWFAAGFSMHQIPPTPCLQLLPITMGPYRSHFTYFWQAEKS